MDEDKKPQEGTEEFQGTDVTEETVATKPVFVVNLFQTARVHTERIDNGFTSKEEAEDYAREICITSEANRGYPYSAWSDTDHPTTSTCNAAPGSYSVSYEDRGYVTILQTDSQDIGSPTNKTVQRVAVEYDAPDVVDANAAKLHVDIGYGAQPRQLIWQDSTPRPIDRLSTEAEAALIAANKRPNRMATFQFFRTGSQIGFRIMVADANKGPVIGGAVSLNEMTIGMRTSHGDYF